MPGRRLPWFKLESGTTSHPKVAMLSDALFRVWVELLDAASRQPRRGRFGSMDEAAAVIRRPVKAIQPLVAARLLDVTEDGVWLHDWNEWQDRYPSDVDRESSVNAPRTLPDDSVNVPPLLTDDSLNAQRTLRDDSPERSDKRKSKSKRENIGGTSASADPPKAPNRSAQVIDSLRAVSLEPTFTSRDHAAVKQSTAPPGLIAEVYGAVFRGEYGDDFMRKRLSVHEAIEWINGYQAWRSQGSPPPARLSLTNGRAEPPRHIVDRTGAPT